MEKCEKVDSDDTLQRLAAADEKAFREVYDRHWKVVYLAAVRYIHSPDLAQDVVQEVFFTLWNRRERLQHIQSLEAYLATMTYHQVYAMLRKWATETKSRKVYSENLEYAVDNTDFAVRAHQYEDMIEVLVDKLPSQQKLVFKMSRRDGMSHEAIARELNLSQRTVKNHMVRALQFLRQNFINHLGILLLMASRIAQKG